MEFSKETLKSKSKRLAFFIFLKITFFILLSIPGIMIGMAYHDDLSWIKWLIWASGFALGWSVTIHVVKELERKKHEFWISKYEESLADYNELLLLYKKSLADYKGLKEHTLKMKQVLDHNLNEKIASIREFVEEFYSGSDIDTFEIYLDDDQGLIINVGNEDQMVSVDTTLPIEDLTERLERARWEIIN